MKDTPDHSDLLLDAAQGLMLSKGFPATRVDEVCAAAGVTKGSFYHHFASKDELAMRLVDHYFDALVGAVRAGTWSKREDPVERLDAFMDHTIRVMSGPLLRRGCLLGSFALDLSETHPEIREAVESRLRALVDAVEPLIRDAMRARGVEGGPSAGALARQFVAVVQGAIVMAKAYADHRRLGEALRCYRAMLAGVIGD